MKVKDGMVSLSDAIYVTSFALKKLQDEMEKLHDKKSWSAYYSIMERRKQLVNTLFSYQRLFSPTNPENMVTLDQLKRAVFDVIEVTVDIHIPGFEDTVLTIGG